MYINKLIMKIGLVFLMAVIMCLISCRSGENASEDFKVQLVNCDGSITHSWISSGSVGFSGYGDSRYFKEKETGIYIQLSGTLIIKTLQRDAL